MTRAIDIAAVERRIGKAWREWLDFLEGIGARHLSHTEIARRVRDECCVGGWWAQAVAVAYEQQIDVIRVGVDYTGTNWRQAFFLSGTLLAIIARTRAQVAQFCIFSP